MRYNEAVVLAYFREMGLPVPVTEFKFCETRKWRFDFCFLEGQVALEVQGGNFAGGSHTRGARLLKEYEKLNEAAALGYRVLYVMPAELCLKETVDLIKRCLKT